MQKYFDDSDEVSIGWPFPRSQPLSGLTGLGHLMTILQRLGDGLAYVVGCNLFALVLFWSEGSVDVAVGLCAGDVGLGANSWRSVVRRPDVSVSTTCFHFCFHFGPKISYLVPIGYKDVSNVSIFSEEF